MYSYVHAMYPQVLGWSWMLLKVPRQKLKIDGDGMEMVWRWYQSPRLGIRPEVWSLVNPDLAAKCKSFTKESCRGLLQQFRLLWPRRWMLLNDWFTQLLCFFNFNLWALKTCPVTTTESSGIAWLHSVSQPPARGLKLKAVSLSFFLLLRFGWLLPPPLKSLLRSFHVSLECCFLYGVHRPAWFTLFRLSQEPRLRAPTKREDLITTSRVRADAPVHLLIPCTKFQSPRSSNYHSHGTESWTWTLHRSLWGGPFIEKGGNRMRIDKATWMQFGWAWKSR